MIIDSLLDTDLYKFTMMQVVFHHFPEVEVEYFLKLRSGTADLRPYVKEINAAIDDFCQLVLSDEEVTYLASCPYFQQDFLDFLECFRLKREHVQIKIEDALKLTIKGTWLQTILFEVPVLAIISEIYFRAQHPEFNERQAERYLNKDIEYVQQQTDISHFKFSDFGTRRRFSKKWQAHVVQRLKSELPQYFIGTSNVLFAKQFGLRPIGTMAHEYIQAFQALVPVRESQRAAFAKWLEEYKGELGIALSDTVGMHAFLTDFDQHFATTYQGARQDSGDPFVWGDQLIAHYQRLGIDPKQKTLVFSDALTMQKAIAIYRYFKDRSNPVFGIGTKLTNNIGYLALDMVIKMIRCNGQAVAKISDEPEKSICCDDDYLKRLKEVFGLK